MLISRLKPQNTDLHVQTLWSYYIYVKNQTRVMLVLRKNYTVAGEEQNHNRIKVRDNRKNEDIKRN